jgi:peptidoglycan hydrolase-like protein with peptidoglycan-binding domain
VAAAALAFDLVGATAVPMLGGLGEAAGGTALPTIEVVCDRTVRASLAVLPDGRLLAPALGGYLILEPAPSDRVREAQELLAAAGFDAGKADGVYGRRTAEAIRAFQAQAGQPATGALSSGLLALLRAAPPQ